MDRTTNTSWFICVSAVYSKRFTQHKLRVNWASTLVHCKCDKSSFLSVCNLFSGVFRESGGGISPLLCLQRWAPVGLNTHTHTHCRLKEVCVCLAPEGGGRDDEWEKTFWRELLVESETQNTPSQTHTHTLLCLVRQGFDPEGTVCVCHRCAIGFPPKFTDLQCINDKRVSQSHNTGRMNE